MTNTDLKYSTVRGRLPRARAILTAVVASLALAACHNLLEVDYPGRIPVEQLNNPELADVLADGVVGDLECAYNNYFSGASAHSDEFEASNDNGTLANAGERNITADNDDYATSACEASSINTAGDFGIQVPMHTARFQAEDIFTRLSGWTEEEVVNKLALQAKVRVYGAYAYTFFGETYCTFAKDGGPAGPPSDASNIAVTEFTEAIQLAQQAISANQTTDPAPATIVNLANVGLARANLDLKKYPEAAAAASQVPAGFEFFADRGTENDRRWNKMYYLFTQLGAYVISNAYRTINDPRLLIADAHKGAFNPDIDLWIQTKFKALGDPVRLASYREAQLILAEAKANTGDIDGALTILNNRRAEVGLGPLAATTDQNTAINYVIAERQVELSFEGGHRLNDLLRKQIPWKVQGTSNPFTGRPYGSTTCWPTPTKETNGH